MYYVLYYVGHVKIGYKSKIMRIMYVLYCTLNIFITFKLNMFDRQNLFTFTSQINTSCHKEDYVIFICSYSTTN